MNKDEREITMMCAKTIEAEGKARIGLFQRRHRLGYIAAAKAMTNLEEAGVVTCYPDAPKGGASPWEVNQDKLAEFLA